MSSPNENLESTIAIAIATALKSELGKWYWLPKLDNIFRSEGCLLAEDIAFVALAGADIPLYSREKESSVIGFISKANIEHGVELYRATGKTVQPNIDAKEADRLLQLIVLGEIAFE